MRLLCDHHVPPKFLTALRSIEGLTATTSGEIEVLGPEADDTEIIAYAEDHDWVVFTDDRRFLIDDEGENPSGEQIDADCGVIFYTQTTVRRPGPTAEAIQAVAEAFADHREIDMYINDWIDRNR